MSKSKKFQTTPFFSSYILLIVNDCQLWTLITSNVINKLTCFLKEASLLVLSKYVHSQCFWKLQRWFICDDIFKYLKTFVSAVHNYANFIFFSKFGLSTYYTKIITRFWWNWVFFTFYLLIFTILAIPLINFSIYNQN